MSDFNLDDLALFTNSAGARVVKIIQILDLDPAHDYIVHAVGGTAYFAHHSELEPLPEGTPAFAAGTPVLVADARRTGTVTAPEFHGEIFGYRIDLDDTGEHVWVPAEVLTATTPGAESANTVVLAIVTGDDGAVVAAVHNPAERAFDIACSHHLIADGYFYRRRYDRGTTDAERDWMLGNAILCATVHAAEKHNTPRTVTEGDQP